MKKMLLLLVSLIPAVLTAQNPIVPPGTCMADPAGRVWEDGKLYIYASRDETTDNYCSFYYDVLSTGDMKNWTVHKDIFAAGGQPGGASHSDQLLFAPDCIYHNGTYYLYYCTGGIIDVEGVATSASPTGPFENGTAVRHAEQIDPAVFIDDDGTAYYLWGQFAAKIARLDPDMKSIDPASIRDSLITEEQHHFHEGIQMFKRNGIYYLAYADISRRGMPTCIGYATSDSPYGPYTYRGVIVDNFGCDPHVWNNHCSVIEFGGDWYVLYHRSTEGSERMRKACVEPITFNPDGTINEVEMTTQGTAGPLNPYARMDAARSCYLTGNVRVHKCAADREQLASIRHLNTAAYKYFDFTRSPQRFTVNVSSDAGGRIEVYANTLSLPLLATVDIPAGDGTGESTITVPVDDHITGVHPVYFRFHGEKEKDLFKMNWFVFE